MNIYIYIYIYMNIQATVRQPHTRIGDSQNQDQEMFLVLSADKQTRNYDTECLNHYPSRSP